MAPISAKDSNALIRRVHYSGKVVNNSQLHLGVFLDGRLEGAMQFGPSLDKRKVQGLVTGTSWNGFIELNRMAFSEALPRNSESRAIAIAMRLIRKHYPHIEWVISFADACQCGDGTIYRASGFVLTAVRRNSSIWVAPDNSIFSSVSLTDGKSKKEQQKALTVCKTTLTKGPRILNALSTRTGNLSNATAGLNKGGASMAVYKAMGFRPLDGFQLRYLYFLNPEARARLTVPVLPFSTIDKFGARMYRGHRSVRLKQAMAGKPPAQRRCDTDPGAPPILDE